MQQPGNDAPSLLLGHPWELSPGRPLPAGPEAAASLAETTLGKSVGSGRGRRLAKLGCATAVVPGFILPEQEAPRRGSGRRFGGLRDRALLLTHGIPTAERGRLGASAPEQLGERGDVLA